MAENYAGMHAITGVVRLLCHVRLVMLILALVSAFTTANMRWLPSMFLVILLLPVSYIPARNWEKTGERIARSGVLLALDLALTGIVISVTGGSQFIYLYAIATAALYGAIVPLILALGMSSMLGLMFLTIGPGSESDTHWILTATIALIVPILAVAGHALGSGLRSRAAAHGRHLLLQQEEIRFKERTRLARDIHDTVAGDLAGALMLTKSLQAKLEQNQVDPGTLEIAEKIAQACQTAHEDTRMALDQLRQSDTPLAEKIASICDRWPGKIDAEVTRDIDPQLNNLPSEVSKDLCLILRELLENVRKHAQASQVHVEVGLVDGACVLNVRDNGRGHDGGRRRTAAPRVFRGGYGLSGIKERLRAHEGQFYLRRAGKTGVHAQAVIPLEEVLQS